MLYSRVFLVSVMKKTLLSVIFFLFFTAVSAETLHTEAINTAEFVADVNSALVSESPEILIKAATPFLSKMNAANIPNCFGCSLYLIKVTEKADPEMQLTAADLAVKFSRDLPEAHHHYFLRLFQFSPFRVDKIITQVAAAAKTSLNFAFSDAVIFLLVRNLSTICLIFFILFLGIMAIKYTELLVHKYRHLTGFSRFYSVSFLTTFFISAWIISKNPHNIIFIAIPFMIFFGDIGTRAEKIVLHITVLFFILSSGFAMLSEKDRPSPYDQNVAFNHLTAIISPDMLPENNIDTSQPGAYMAKGFLFLYSNNFSRAAFNLKKELASAEIPEIKAILSNATGVALASNGKAKEAIPYLREAYEQTGNKKIGYNLAKALYEDGFKEESAALESKILDSTNNESFPYPYLHISNISVLWKYFCSGNNAGNSRNRMNCMIYIVSTLLYYLFIILIKYCYVGSLEISRCPECGIVTCSKCNAGGSDVCAVCKLMKADYTLFKRGEREIYEERRERFFKTRSIFMNFLTFLLPGGGLMFVNKTFEGSLYMAVPLVITLVYFFNTMGLVVDTTDGIIAKTSIVLIDLFFYFLSVVRALFAARRS